MQYYKITAIVNNEEETDKVVASLLLLGAPGVEIKNPCDEDFAKQNEYEWDFFDAKLLGNIKSVIAYIELNNSISKDDIEKKLYDDLDSSRVNIEVEDSALWENEWKKCLKPVVSGKILVTPSCEYTEQIDDSNKKYNPSDYKHVIYIDPGCAFGTGSHDTTKLCLELLQNNSDYVKGNAVLDIGTGSGILAIASSAIGAKSVTAVDIDPLAVDTARVNIDKNGAKNISLYCGDLTDNVSGKYKLVVANIIAGAIVELSSNIANFMEDDSLFIASGIIDDKLELVRTALSKNGFIILDERNSNGWNAIVAKTR